MKKESERLGIAYTPIPLVNFILHSVDDILKAEFEMSLTDENVHILDPFTGTGTFLVQLLQSGLIHPDDLERKYRKELHANEILLLAYYIASVNIEEAYRGQRGEEKGYEPFDGIVLTDTFNLNKAEEDTPGLFEEQQMEENNERVQHQQNLPIEVIIGNPPWSVGQKNAADNNPNVECPALEERIKDTFVKYATVKNKNSLYDSYKMAIRWASDRIKEQGIVAFVTPASWIDGNVDAGIRACLAKEFTSIYALNLLGNARIGGENGKYQGEGVFGNATQSPVAISFLVKNTNAEHEGCRIHYRDIGGHLKREQKLEILIDEKSVKRLDNWQVVTPDEHHDWIDQRSETFTRFYPLGTKEAKAGKADNAIFGLFSGGYQTGRDKYIYNFSRPACAENAEKMAQDYINAISELENNPERTADEVSQRHNKNIKWDDQLRGYVERERKTDYNEDYIRKVMYRPFVKTNCYADYTFAQRKYQMDKIFPYASSENRVICVPGISSKTPFSVLMTDTMPDRGINNAAQCFPRWQYPKSVDTKEDILFSHKNNDGCGKGLDRIDNISDTALKKFQQRYQDNTITKDGIFDYVYGILHAPSYREQFANDVSKMLPRIPYAPDFRAFADAGKALAQLHLNYEICEQYPNLKVEPITPSLLWEGKSEHFRLGQRAMRYKDKDKRKKDILIINEHVMLTGIPEAAHRYIVNGRTPLERFINRYKIETHKDSGIVNDPNGWFADPRDLVTAIARIIHVSVESALIIDTLPPEITTD